MKNTINIKAGGGGGVEYNNTHPPTNMQNTFNSKA